MIILAIETSCDETSVAIIKDKQVLSNVIASQISLHQMYGGVVPELAARAHSDNISQVLTASFNQAQISPSEIDYVAFTKTPGLISCLHVGQVIAETFALSLNKPLIPVNHLQGHIYASLITQTWKFPVLGLLVSGGHTQLIFMKEHLDFTIIGQTFDDAVGECYDKVARMLGLNYPGGPAIAEAAITGKDVYQLPLPKKDLTLDFSFSGLKSAAAKIINHEQQNLNINNFACSLQTTITKILLYKVCLAIKQYQPKTVVLAGGVSANEHLRNNFLQLKTIFPDTCFLVPDLAYCTDNAAMIGILAHYLVNKSNNKES